MDDLIWRAPNREDVAALAEMIQAVEVADDIPEVTSPDRMAWELTTVEDPEHDLIMAVSGDGRPVAFAQIGTHRGGVRKYRVPVSVYVHPDRWAGSLGDQLLERTDRRCREILAECPPDLPHVIRGWGSARSRYLRDLYGRHGYAAARLEAYLRRPATTSGPDVQTLEGIAIEPWTTGRSNDARLAHNEAFLDHWGSEPVSEKIWIGSWVGDPGFRADLSFVALDGDKLVGYLLAEVHPDDFERLGLTEGWIGTVGVVRTHRRRGIAAVLIARAVAAMRDDGLEYASLDVDTESLTGAFGLYERLGFSEFYRTVTYVKEVAV